MDLLLAGLVPVQGYDGGGVTDYVVVRHGAEGGHGTVWSEAAGVAVDGQEPGRRTGEEDFEFGRGSDGVDAGGCDGVIAQAGVGVAELVQGGVSEEERFWDHVP